MSVGNYVPPRWVEEGMDIVAPYNAAGTGVRCKVAVAAGTHARVINEKRSIDRWYPLNDLRVPVGDIHA